MKKILFAVAMCVLSLSAQAYQILATVDDEVITDVDVKNRQELLAALMGSELDKKQALDLLIDEKTRYLVALKSGIEVSEAEVAQRIADLEEQNKMPTGAMTAFLKEQGLSQSSLKDQLKADIVWMRYLAANIEKPDPVSDKQVQKELDKMRAELGKASYLLAEIFIPFGDNEQAAEQEAETLFNRIVAGESFTDLAQEYSKGKTASLKGDLGWVKQGQLEKALDKALPKINVGQLSRPIKGKKGYTILLMRDVKPALDTDMQPVWQISQLIIDKQDYPALRAELEKVSNSCFAFTPFAQKNGVEGSHSGQLMEMPAYKMPSELKAMLDKTAVGQMAGPIEMEQYLLFVMKCDAKVVSVLPSKELVRAELEERQVRKLSDEMAQKVKSKVLIEKK